MGSLVSLAEKSAERHFLQSFFVFGRKASSAAIHCEMDPRKMGFQP